MQHGIEKLQPGVRDMPRLSKILRNKHHFLLLPAPLLKQYKGELADSLSPQIETLIERAERILEREEAKKAGLKERLELLKSAQPSTRPTAIKPITVKPMKPFPSSSTTLDVKELNPMQRRKMMILKGKRERLEKEMARLRE